MVRAETIIQRERNTQRDRGVVRGGGGGGGGGREKGWCYCLANAIGWQTNRPNGLTYSVAFVVCNYDLLYFPP